MRPLIVLAPLATLALAALAAPAEASASGVLVSEFRTRGPGGAADEFVELLNAGSAPVDISGWKLQACAQTGSISDRATVPALASLEPGQHFLFAHASGYTGSVAADVNYSAGISDSGGLRVVDASGLMVDGVASTSGGAPCREGTGLALPTSGGEAAFARLDGGRRDTDDNAADFAASGAGDPENLLSALAPAPPVPELPALALAGAGLVALALVRVARR